MKCIIDIEEKPLCVFDEDTHTYFPRLWRVKGFNSLVFDEEGLSRLEELNSDYINEHFGDLQETAYQKGLDDAWEAARKIFGYEMDGGIPINELGKVFGYAEDAIFCTADIIRHNTAQEAIEKLKAYEEKQKADELKVGDEVEWTGDKYIVTYINYDIDKSEITDYDLLGDDGSVADHVKKCSFTKTGRHFDIQKILEEMTND